MLTRLDPHSDYMDQDQYQQMTAVTRGQFGGIGVELTLEGKVPEVISPIDGTPAAEAGIQAGDVVLAANGAPVNNAEELRGAVEKSKGHIALLIQRGDTRLFVPGRVG